MAAGSSFATGFLNSINKNFEQSREAEAQWRQMKFKNFMNNTLPSYKKDKQKANKIRGLAKSGKTYLVNQQGLDEEKASEVAYAYASKYDNPVDYMKNLRKDIEGPLDQQTQEATQGAMEESVPESDPISAWQGVENTEENREALKYDMAENTDRWTQRIKGGSDYIDEMRMQGGQGSGSQNTQPQDASVNQNQNTSSQPRMAPEGDAQGWISRNIFGNPDYTQASNEAYQRISQMTGYSPGMIKLIEMGKAVDQPQQGDLSGVRMAQDTESDYEGLASQVEQNWADLSDDQKTAYMQYRDSGDPEDLRRAAAGIQPSSDDTSRDDLGRMIHNKVVEYQRENPDLDGGQVYQSMVNEGILTPAQAQLHVNWVNYPSMNDQIRNMTNIAAYPGANAGRTGAMPGPEEQESIANEVEEEMKSESGAGDNSRSEGGTPKDRIPAAALDDQDADEIATNLQAEIQREQPENPAKFAQKWLKQEGYTKDAAEKIMERFR